MRTWLAVWFCVFAALVEGGVEDLFGGPSETSQSRSADRPLYLADDLADRIVSVSQDWGALGLDTAVRPPNGQAMSLRIASRSYRSGLGHHANGEIRIDLGGAFLAFEADIGLQWQGGQNVGSVVFQVFVDGRKRFDSGVVRESDPPRQVRVDVRGATELRLVATDAGDGITCDCADWAEARLWPNPRTPARPSPPSVNLAAFARVCTWDPKRSTGTAATRIQEFPAEDVFLARRLLPGPNGSYQLPVTAEGIGCIGLEWDESRFLRELGLEFAPTTPLSPTTQIRLEYWAGESPWQGRWQVLPPRLHHNGGNLSWTIGFADAPAGTRKVRWLFTDLERPVEIRGFTVFSRSAWRAMDLRLESEHPDAAHPVSLEVYNGQLLQPTNTVGSRLEWDGAAPLELQVRYSQPTAYKGDRTVLRFHCPQAAFGLAIEDLLTNDCVYAPIAGIFATRLPAPITLAAYRERIAGQHTMLESVRTRPDQTFAQALARVHNPIQDLGPMMLSLACDNRKFVVHRDGTVVFDLYDQSDDPPRDFPTQFRLAARFGSGKSREITRCLDGGWLPIPATTVKTDGLEYRQRTFVVPLDDAPAGGPVWRRDQALAVAEYAVQNPRSEPAEFSVSLTLASRTNSPAWQSVAAGALAVQGERLLAVADFGRLPALNTTLAGATITLHGTLPAGGHARWSVYLPAWPVPPDHSLLLTAHTNLDQRLRDYWTGVLAPAMQIDLPDPLLANVIRASQVHCLLAARNEARGQRVAPWISSDRYGPLESEGHAVIRGLDLWGHTDVARRALEFFLRRYQPSRSRVQSGDASNSEAAYLTTGYTLIGTGENLWTLAEHYGRTQDRAWLRQVAPTVAGACRWIYEQRAKTRQLDSSGQPTPQSGLMPPGVSADWNRFAYRFFNDAQYCAGLESAAAALASIGYPDAAKWVVEGRAYRADLLRAYHWTQARSPVVRLASGAWAPSAPALLDCFGQVEEFLPGEDGNRSWAYSVELGAHHLAANRLLPPPSPETDWLVNYLEDVQFLRSGMGEYQAASNHLDWFNLGGFAKVQPYYARIAEVYALRDDVKPFLRAYFNAIPSLLSLENLSFWEHFHNQGGWNKTHETGWFLCQSRLLLVQERGNELWLAPFVPEDWLRQGGHISVSNAPTAFGEIDYAISSSIDQGFIQADVQPPRRAWPQRTVLRLRPPGHRAIRAISLNGESFKDFDAARQCIFLPSDRGPLRVRVAYAPP